MFLNFSSLEILVFLAISSFVFTILLQPYIIKLGNKLKLIDSPSPRKQKKKSLNASTETEDIYIEDIGESMYQVGNTNKEQEIVIVEDIERSSTRETKI